MSINWEELEKNIDVAIQAGTDSTNKKLYSKISSVTRLTDEEISEMLPDEADVKKLSKLMTIIKSAENDNIKVKKLADNVQELGSIAIKLIDKLT
ncbi:MULTISPECIES: hypothetical protein [unclassified Pseudoalteromonas]|uniref:hypothetical protein n=1 Tax=unclassified Pseudoalteromonas TaxID=194690 RepID=UPI0025B3FA5F|nr:MULTISPECIES: hypothetical protein [unclassified Pseudoalteromonas]MDN3378711.1 hypothetical protein [Pseudoalteromonas sp. APC 3893]MDN3387200.1 hypothetical protein [Pseudoalteromonas sp. APC 4017]